MRKLMEGDIRSILLLSNLLPMIVLINIKIPIHFYENYTKEPLHQRIDKN